MMDWSFSMASTGLKDALASVFTAGSEALGPNQVQLASATILFVLSMGCFATKRALDVKGLGVMGQTLLAIAMEALARNLWLTARQYAEHPNAFGLVNVLLIANVFACMVLLAYFVHSLKWNNVLLKSDNVSNLTITASSPNTSGEEHFSMEAATLEQDEGEYLVPNPTHEETADVEGSSAGDLKDEDEPTKADEETTVASGKEPSFWRTLPTWLERLLGDRKIKSRIVERKRSRALMTVQ